LPGIEHGHHDADERPALRHAHHTASG
jgi:hypothetical protein